MAKAVRDLALTGVVAGLALLLLGLGAWFCAKAWASYSATSDLSGLRNDLAKSLSAVEESTKRTSRACAGPRYERLPQRNML